VPFTGSVAGSTKPPLVPTVIGATTVVPSGLRIDTFVLQQTGAIFRLTR